MRMISVTEKIDFLPIGEAMTWERFQIFSTDLLYRRFNCIDSREYLKKGNTQDGIDVYGITGIQKPMTVAQCKLEKRLTSKKISDVIDLFLKGSFAAQTNRFVLCTSADLATKRFEKSIGEARMRLAEQGIELVVWDKQGISAELRQNATSEMVTIVFRYFDEDIALAFYGEKVWGDYIRNLRPVDKPKYVIPADHIERHITTYESQLNDEDTWPYWIPKPKRTLASFYDEANEKRKKHYVLLSVAGFGKTQEVQYLAGSFASNDKLLLPFRYLLCDYQGENIEVLLKGIKNWENVKNSLLLIFDGLDETVEQYQHAFIKKLNVFLELNGDVKVLITSRFNFYDVRANPLRGFEILLLNELNRRDIEEYLDEKLVDQKNIFIELLAERKLDEYLSNPYYLIRMVRFFRNAPKRFPRNKTALFEAILFEQLENDEHKFHRYDLKEKLWPVAQKIAFCMTMAGKATVDDNEMKQLVPDAEIRKELKLFRFLNHESKGQGSWRFEHKNLQEYLCASLFAEKSFAEVHKVMSYEFDRNKQLPGFLNTVSFLYEFIDKQSTLFRELADWMSINEPELLVRFEKEQLDKQTRNHILYQLFEAYERKGIVLRASQNFYLEELANFVELDQAVITYLGEKISQGANEDFVYDAISLIAFCKRPFVHKRQIIGILFGVLRSDRFKGFVHGNAISCLCDLQFKSKDIFEGILNSCINLNNYEVRWACIRFLAETDYYEDYIEFLLQSVRILEAKERSSNYLVSYDLLQQLLASVERSTSIKKILAYCIIDKDTITRHKTKGFELEEDQVQRLLAKATLLYPSETRLLAIVYRLYCGIEYIYFEPKLFQPFADFFINTCGSKVIFWKFYRFDRTNREFLFFADEECLESLLEHYSRDKISDDEMNSIRNVLSHTNWQLFKWFYDKLIAMSAKFELSDIDVDYTELNVAQEQRNGLMLQDQKLFLNEAEVIFNIINKEQIETSDLWYSENKLLRPYSKSLVLATIRDNCIHDDDKTITEEEFITKYSDAKQWEGFVIDSVVDHLEHKLPVEDELIELLKNWCTEQAKKIDFRNCVADNEDGTYNYWPNKEFVKKAILLCNPALPDEKLANLIIGDYNYFHHRKEESKTIVQWVRERISDPQLLKTNVLAAVKDENLSIRTRQSMFRVCTEMELSECLPELYDIIIQNPHVEDYDRKTLTEYYLQLGGEITDFRDQLTVPQERENGTAYSSYHWFLLENLIDEEPEMIAGIAVEVLNTAKKWDSRSKAAELLIRLGSLEGLQHIASEMKNELSDHFYIRWANLIDDIKELPFPSSADILLEVLTHHVSNGNRGNMKHNRVMDDFVYHNLTAISQVSFDHYNYIKNKLSGIIQGNVNDAAQAVRYFSERLSHSFFASQQQPVSLTEAVLSYNTLKKDAKV
jgi:hypothetical protein